MRHGLITAATAAIIAATGALLTAPLAAAPLAAPRLAAPATATSDLVPVQYWGGWGSRYDDYDDEPPVYRRRYVVPEVEDVIPPSEAVAIARSMGYRAISRPRLAGRVWVVETVGGAGQRARVTINAYSGAPINIRELEPSGPRFPTPPVWPEERPNFGRDGAPRPPPIREGRLDPGFDQPERLDRPDRLDRPERPARPAPNITARAVPVPEPRPNLGGGLDERPVETPPLPPVASPPPAEAPVAPPPAASVPPRRVDPPAAVPVPQSPPLSVEPQQPITPPAAAVPQAVEPTPPPAPAVTAPPVEPAPPAAAAPAPQPDRSAVQPPAAPPRIVTPPPAADPPVAVQPPQVTPPAPAAPTTETAQKPESEGVLIDGRFLGPNGEAPPPGSRP